jgi:protein involved in temperature-dependent protein secretion
VQRGLVTRWREVAPGLVEGVGQHVWFCGDEDIALLDISQLEVASAAASQGQP